MNRPFRIVPYRPDGDFATLYTVQVEGRPTTETELFRRSPVVRAAREFDVLWDRFERLHESEGLYHRNADSDPYRWFHGQGDGCSALCAPPPTEEKDDVSSTDPVLRLYGFRLDRLALSNCLHVLDGIPGPGLPIAVFCSGGVKTTLRAQDCPNVAGLIREMKHVKRRLVERLDYGDIQISDDLFELEGDLVFPAQP